MTIINKKLTHFQRQLKLPFQRHQLQMPEKNKINN